MQIAPGSIDYFAEPKRDWSVDPDVLMRWGLQRYGESWRGHEDLCAAFMAAPFFVFIQHPLMEAMARADYG
jgi:hypothetical protein